MFSLPVQVRWASRGCQGIVNRRRRDVKAKTAVKRRAREHRHPSRRAGRKTLGVWSMSPSLRMGSPRPKKDSPRPRQHGIGDAKCSRPHGGRDCVGQKTHHGDPDGVADAESAGRFHETLAAPTARENILAPNETGCERPSRGCASPRRYSKGPRPARPRSGAARKTLRMVWSRWEGRTQHSRPPGPPAGTGRRADRDPDERRRNGSKHNPRGATHRGRRGSPDQSHAGLSVPRS